MLYLPGTDITFEMGKEMWVDGLAFASNPDGTVYVSDQRESPIKEMVDMILRIITNTPSFKPTAAGSYNNYYSLQSCHIEWVRFFLEKIMVTVELNNVGFRKGKATADSDFGFQETWMMLHAAARGVHPLVHGSVYENGFSYFVMQEGIDLHRYLASNPGAERFARNPLSALLQTALQKVSEMGLLLSDNKASNMILLIDEAGTPTEILFIDFGADFARLDNADTNCVWFVNAFLLVNQLKCDLRNQAVKLMTSGIRLKLGELLEGYKASSQDGLCDIISRIRSFRARRWPSMYTLTRPSDVARGVIKNATHYNRKCGTLGQFDQNRPVVPQLLEAANQLLAAFQAPPPPRPRTRTPSPPPLVSP